MKKDNSGFTLAELIVVIALLGILAVFVGASISTAFSGREKALAVNVDAYLSMCRSRCLSRGGQPYIELSQDGETGEVWGKYYENGKQLEEESLGGKGVLVSYYIGKDSPNNEKELHTETLKISFSGSTGAMETPEENLWIYVGKYKIKIYALTGAHRFE